MPSTVKPRMSKQDSYKLTFLMYFHALIGLLFLSWGLAAHQRRGCLVQIAKHGCYRRNSTNISLLDEFYINNTGSPGTNWGESWLTPVLCRCAEKAKEEGYNAMALEMQHFQHASCMPATFDFEKGENSVRDWNRDGTAFAFQPTFGDNPTARGREEARQQGNYWIGGYEKRPTPQHPAGATQGDVPMGYLTSPRFFITGSDVSFLLGGGCDITKERVELIVDGRAVRSATGRCKETMLRHHWNVDEFKTKAAQLRLVDQSSTGWGHINFDDFRGDIAFCKVGCLAIGHKDFHKSANVDSDQCIAEHVRTCETFSSYCVGQRGTIFVYNITGDINTKCSAPSSYTLRHVDFALSKHIILTRLVSDVGECARNCFHTLGCVSFNIEYKAEGMKTCEINSSTKELDMASFVKRSGFAYFS